MEREDQSISLTINTNKSYFKMNEEAQKIQKELIKMGFDISMINKVITYFQIKSVEEGIHYLTKIEGKWEHPFIKSEKNENEQKKISISSLPQKYMRKISVIQKFEEENELCEICGEPKTEHRINENDLNDTINNKNNNDIKNSEESKIISDDNNICKICLGNFDNPIQIETCKHKFCKECFKEYILDRIINNNIETMPCPNKLCNNKNIPEEYFFTFLNEEQYLKYQNFKSQNQISKDPNKIFCPICNSYAEINENKNIINTNNSNYKKTTLKCKNGHEFCSCGRPNHEGNCYKDENEFISYLKEQKIKKCPKCGFLIKKDHGCNHMTCGNPNCKYEFCWICMKESLPDHFKEGPCAGLQFLDEESYMYYIRMNYPKIYCIIQSFICIYITIIFLLFILIPCLSFIVIFYYMIVHNNAIFARFKCGQFTKKIMRWVMFSIISSALIILLPIFYTTIVIIIVDSILNCIFSCLTDLFCQNREREIANLL